jgi:hypothetical protein
MKNSIENVKKIQKPSMHRRVHLTAGYATKTAAPMRHHSANPSQSPRYAIYIAKIAVHFRREPPHLAKSSISATGRTTALHIFNRLDEIMQ